MLDDVDQACDVSRAVSAGDTTATGQLLDDNIQIRYVPGRSANIKLVPLRSGPVTTTGSALIMFGSQGFRTELVLKRVTRKKVELIDLTVDDIYPSRLPRHKVPTLFGRRMKDLAARLQVSTVGIGT